MFKWWQNLKIKWAKRELEKYAPKGEHLAYISKEEAELLKKHGGAGLKVTKTGIPSFFLNKIVRGIKDFVGGVGDAVSSFFGGFFDFVEDIVEGVVDFASSLVNGVLGMFGFSFDMPEYDSPSSFEAYHQGILVNKQSAVAGIPVVYGKRRIGGTRVFLDTYGDNNEYLVVCLALCEGEINGINKIFINDQQITLPNRSGSDSLYTKETVQSIGSRLANGQASPFFVNGKARAKFEIFHGTEDQQVSSILSGSTYWSPNHRLRGVAYIACRFEWVKAEFEGGEQTVFNPWQGVPTIQAEVYGKKVLTAYSSADNTDADVSTYEAQSQNTGVGAFEYSDNPANCLLDYLRNPRYGKGLNDNRIDFGAFRNAKLTAEQSIDFSDDFTSNFMSCNAVISTEDTIMNNTKRLLQSCRGFLPYVDGKYRVKIETAEIPVDQFEITDDMIIGEIAIQSPDKNAKYNECHLTYADEDLDFETNTFVYRDEDAAAEDGEPLILKTSMPTVTKIDRVKHIAKYLVDRSRKQLTVGIRTTNEGQSIVAGDLVRITHKYNRTVGGTDITDYLFKSPTGTAVDTVYTAPEMIFRVIATTLNYDGTVSLQLVEHDNFIYAITREAPTPIPEPPITPPPDPGPPGPDPEPPTPEPPKQCDEGFHYDYDLLQCVPDEDEPVPDPEPTPDPPPQPPQTGPVKVATGTRNGYEGYIKFTISPSRTTNNVIGIDMTNANTNYRQIWSVVAAATTITYEIRSGSRGMTIKQGQVLEYKVFEADTNGYGQHILGQGNVIVAGSATSNSVSSTNASQGGYA